MMLPRRTVVLGLPLFICGTRQRFTAIIIRNGSDLRLQISYEFGETRRKVLHPGEQLDLDQKAPGCLGNKVPLREDLRLATIYDDRTRVQWTKKEIQDAATWDPESKSWFLIVTKHPARNRSPDRHRDTGE